MCKKHFRLYELAVKKEYQGKGYGNVMIARMKQLCQKSGAKKITFRANMEEGSVSFYKRIGGEIVGTKGRDYEMEIRA